MIESVNPISFPLVNDATFKEQIVSSLESNNFLLLVWIYWSVVVVYGGELICSSVSDHVICEI